MNKLRHIKNLHGDCLSWCPACGPPCNHKDNSYECIKCKEESKNRIIDQKLGHGKQYIIKLCVTYESGQIGIETEKELLEACSNVLNDKIQTIPIEIIKIND